MMAAVKSELQYNDASSEENGFEEEKVDLNSNRSAKYVSFMNAPVYQF